MIFWEFEISMTKRITIRASCMTPWVLMMHHHTRHGCKKFTTDEISQRHVDNKVIAIYVIPLPHSSNSTRWNFIAINFTTQSEQSYACRKTTPTTTENGTQCSGTLAHAEHVQTGPQELRYVWYTGADMLHNIKHTAIHTSLAKVPMEKVHTPPKQKITDEVRLLTKMNCSQPIPRTHFPFQRDWNQQQMLASDEFVSW